MSENIKLSRAQVNAAVDYYNAHNGAEFDYLHATDGVTVFRRIVREIPHELAEQSMSSGSGGRKPVKVIRLDRRKILPFIMEDGEPFCKLAELDALRAEFNLKTYGDALELYYKRLEDPSAVWVKDSTEFWVAGDIRLNGVEVQLKFGGARLAAYSCLHD